MTEAKQVLVLDCGSITNPDATADMAALTAAMGAATTEDAKRGMDAAWRSVRADLLPGGPDTYWTTALTEAGVIEAGPATRAAVDACERCVHTVLSTKFDDTLDTAKKLKAAGVLVGIISNHVTSPPWFQRCAESAKLYELASDPSLVVVSQNVRVAKPDPAIYNLFHDRLRQKFGEIPASSLWFVDDKAKNVDAARALGWNGVVFNATTTTSGLLPELAAAGLSP